MQALKTALEAKRFRVAETAGGGLLVAPPKHVAPRYQPMPGTVADRLRTAFAGRARIENDVHVVHEDSVGKEAIATRVMTLGWRQAGRKQRLNSVTVTRIETPNENLRKEVLAFLLGVFLRGPGYRTRERTPRRQQRLF